MNWILLYLVASISFFLGFLVCTMFVASKKSDGN